MTSCMCIPATYRCDPRDIESKPAGLKLLLAKLPAVSKASNLRGTDPLMVFEQGKLVTSNDPET